MQWDRGAARLRRDVVGSIAVSLFTQLALLLSGVAGARILGVLDRGRSALLLLFATVLPLLGTLGLPLSVTYWIARSPVIARRLVGRLRRTVVVQTAGLVVVHAGVLAIVFGGASGHVQVAAAISLLGTPSIVAFLYALGVLQGTRDFRALNLSRLIFPPLNAALLMLVLVAGVGDLWLVTAAWVALYWVSAIVAAAAARRSVRRASADDDGTEPLPGRGEMLRFGAKALLGSMSPLTGFQLDQAIVGLFISQAALGIYVVAVAFTNLPRFVAQSIGLVAYPHVAAEPGGRGAARSIVRFTALTLVLCGAVVAVTELALPYLVAPLFGHAFAPAVAVARILLIGSLLFCLTRTLSDCARGAGRPGLGTIAEIVSLVAIFPFVALLAGSGAQGVATAVAIAAGCGVASIVIGLVAPWRGRWPGGRLTWPTLRLTWRPWRGGAAPAVATGVAVVAGGAALAASGAGPAVGVAAGLVVLLGVALLGARTDGIMWTAVAMLVLTVSWNGIRIGGGAFGDGFMLMAFAAVVIHHVLTRRSLLIPGWLVLSAIGFLLAALLVVIFPPSVGLANRAVVQQESLLIVPGFLPPRSNLSFLLKFELSLVLTPLIVAAAATSWARCRRLLDLWAIGAFVNAAVGLADYAGIAHLAPTPLAANRSAGLTIHPNYLALTAVMGIPAAMIWIGRSRRWTVAGLIAVPTLLGGVYASGSRAGTVAAAAAVLLTALLLPRFRRKLLPLLPVAGMAILALLLFTRLGGQILHQLRLSGGPSAAGSDAQRSQDAQLALAQIGARPLAGVGFSVIQDAHDIYLQVLAAGGVVALAAFLTYLGGLAAAARRAWAAAPRDLTVAAGVTILMWLVNGLFDNQLADKYLYVIPGVLLGLSRLSPARAAAPARAPAAPVTDATPYPPRPSAPALTPTL